MWKRLVNRLRYWAIEKLAGGRTIILNAHIHGTPYIEFSPKGGWYVRRRGGMQR